MGARAKKTHWMQCTHYGQGRARVLTGTFTGDGTDDRNINIGVDLTAKSNVYIIIKGQNAAVHRIEYAQGDNTMVYASGSDFSNGIQALTATGFQVGSDSRVNQNLITMRYIVFYEE